MSLLTRWALERPGEPTPPCPRCGTVAENLQIVVRHEQYRDEDASVMWGQCATCAALGAERPEFAVGVYRHPLTRWDIHGGEAGGMSPTPKGGFLLICPSVGELSPPDEIRAWMDELRRWKLEYDDWDILDQIDGALERAEWMLRHSLAYYERGELPDGSDPPSYRPTGRIWRRIVVRGQGEVPRRRAGAAGGAAGRARSPSRRLTYR